MRLAPYQPRDAVVAALFDNAHPTDIEQWFDSEITRLATLDTPTAADIDLLARMQQERIRYVTTLPDRRY